MGSASDKVGCSRVYIAIMRTQQEKEVRKSCCSPGKSSIVASQNGSIRIAPEERMRLEMSVLVSDQIKVLSNTLRKETVAQLSLFCHIKYTFLK